jgi:MtaA/CmuA family methyltransferase
MWQRRDCLRQCSGGFVLVLLVRSRFPVFPGRALIAGATQFEAKTDITMTSQERVIAHLQGKPVDHLPLMPITMMFATDLVGIPYGEYCRDHRKLVQAQVNVAEQFGFDFVSCISDPAREAADCGATIQYFENQPPAIVEDQARLADKTELARLKCPDPLGGGRMTDRVQAARLFRERCGSKYLVEGWVEGPCAEGADLRGINTLMLDFFDDPAFVRDLFAFIVDMELRFARAQVEAGVDIIGVGDAAASLVGPEVYEEFVWPFEKKLVDGIHGLGALVRLHICGNTRRILRGMGRLECDIVDLDYPSPVQDGRQQMGPAQVLLGNANPVAVLRNGTAEMAAATVAQCHKEAGPRYIAGAGCEVPRDTPHENLRAFCQYALTHAP